jgi:hypothetical protein
MKTHIHTYNFDISRPDEAAAYKALCKELGATPGRGEKMVSSSTGEGHFWFIQQRLSDGAEIELETAHLFENQWNTAPIVGIDTDKGLRVFDWAEDASDRLSLPGFAPKDVRRGYYLDITDEMRAIRHDTLKCGYCGAQENAAGIDQTRAFCPHCRDSEFLKESDLHLTRLRPVDTPFGEKRAELTDDERAYLLPIYREAQIHGSTARGKARLEAKRARILAKAEKEISAANAERDGMLWLMDRRINVENVIYYSHTGRFSFGWRSPLDDGVVDSLLDEITEFPFPYDIITAPGGKHGGRKLSGER